MKNLTSKNNRRQAADNDIIEDLKKAKEFLEGENSQLKTDKYKMGDLAKNEINLY